MKESFDDIFNLNPRYSTTIGFILGILLIDGLTVPEQNLLGNWIILIGQTILTNASSQNVIQDRIKGGIININSQEIKCVYNPIVYNIDKIRDIVNKVYPDNSIDMHLLKKTLNKLQEEIECLNKK
jgi:hypothetical protein